MLGNTSHHNDRVSNPDASMMALERDFCIKTMWQKLVLDLRCAKSGGGEGTILEDAFKRGNGIKVELQVQTKSESAPNCEWLASCAHEKKEILTGPRPLA